MRSSLLSVLLFTSAGVLVHGVALAQPKTPPAAVPPAAPPAAPVPPAALPAPASAPPVGATPPPAAPAAPAAPPIVAPPPVAAPPVAAPPIPPPARAAAPIEIPKDGTVEVHLDSVRLVSLERRASTGASWERVCNSPCDARTPSGLEYRVVGIGVNPSRPFRISPSATGKVQLSVAPGLRKKETLGIGVAIAGGVVTVAGLIVVIAGSSSANTFQADGLTHNGNTDFIAAGSLMMLGGLAAVITGGAWAIDNSRSKVDGDVVTPAGKDAAVSRAGQLARAGTQMGFALPVFSGSF